MRSMQPVFISVGQGKRVKMDSTSMPTLAEATDQESIFPFLIDNASVSDLTAFPHADEVDSWDKEIKLRKVLVCDTEGNQYHMVVLGSGLLLVT